MTPEQQAIRQHLSKPAPNSQACGCMGPQPMHSSGALLHEKRTYRVKVKLNAGTKIKGASVIKTMFNLSMVEVREVLRNLHFVSFESPYHTLSSDLDRLREFGEVSVLENGPPMAPFCPCAMAYVEAVEGVFYHVKEHRSPDGITHTATRLGPVGGPYEKGPNSWLQ